MSYGRSASARPRVLYILTDEISRLLVAGQLAHVRNAGFDVIAASRWAHPDRPAEGWDEGIELRNVSFRREPAVLDDLRALWATVSLIREIRPDIVNASTPKAGLLGMVAAWLCRVPVRVYVVRGLRIETTRGVKRALLWLLERLAVVCANEVVFNSASLRREAQRQRLIGRGRGVVLGAGSGNGIDACRFERALASLNAARSSLGLAPNVPVVGFVGRLTNDKGIGDLVGAFELLAAQDPNVELLLVGSYEEGDALPASLRTEIESHPRIRHAGWLSRTETAYRAMDVLAFPSYREGLPNVPLEAQLCGVPVVGYAATGTVDAVMNRRGLVPVGDVAALAAVTRSSLDGDHPTAAELRAWVVHNFDRTRVWAELVSLYRSLLRDPTTLGETAPPQRPSGA